MDKGRCREAVKVPYNGFHIIRGVPACIEGVAGRGKDFSAGSFQYLGDVHKLAGNFHAVEFAIWGAPGKAVHGSNPKVPVLRGVHGRNLVVRKSQGVGGGEVLVELAAGVFVKAASRCHPYMAVGVLGEGVYPLVGNAVTNGYGALWKGKGRVIALAAAGKKEKRRKDGCQFYSHVRKYNCF